MKIDDRHLSKSELPVLVEDQSIKEPSIKQCLAWSQRTTMSTDGDADNNGQDTYLSNIDSSSE